MVAHSNSEYQNSKHEESVTKKDIEMTNKIMVSYSPIYPRKSHGIRAKCAMRALALLHFSTLAFAHDGLCLVVCAFCVTSAEQELFRKTMLNSA